MADDAIDFLLDYRNGLERQSRVQRRRRYTSRGFPDELEMIGRTLKALGYPKERISDVIHSGAGMRLSSSKLRQADLKVMKEFDSIPMIGDTPDMSDGYYINIGLIANEIMVNQTQSMEREILKKIDMGFTEPTGMLIATVKAELAESREFLLNAVKAFAVGNREEAAVNTRKAWESCVLFALLKLPKKGELDSLNKKSKYVLEQLGFKDESKSITEVKNLFEGRFLHALASGEKLADPELPFYIALTTGFVHLVSSHLAS